MTDSKRQRVTVGDEMILAKAIKPILQANQRSEQEQTTPSGIWRRELGICKFLLLSFIASTGRNLYILQISSTLQCPKQKNDTDCGVFTCLFAKHLSLSRGNHSGLTRNGEPRDEMVSDLLNLASALRAENDLPKVFRLFGDSLLAEAYWQSAIHWKT
ncbi:hypothetical protein pdam_00023514 [Pocillopora damicornis]|uniref:Ubiquitin-like protease family profile domain-containing protein n=1 Tax=Pocillopora damicornis TaxID=46731 RepID=A0A3M6UUR8_POCDA|nr:hypothetical protein pdam_00023514 [Pocillopora damicornis]